MPKRNKKFGAWGEELARGFLLRRNYEIMGSNFQKRCGEIDIIARKDKVLHFVEVKTRRESSTKKFGMPEEAVGRTKQKKMIKTALFYLAEKRFSQNTDWQMDVITVVYKEKEKTAKITFIGGAFDES